MEPLSIEERLAAVEARNAAVTRDKAWEGSLIRRLSIAALTYFILALFMSYSGTAHPWVSAVIPTVGYLFSTLTLTVLKKRFLERH